MVVLLPPHVPTGNTLTEVEGQFLKIHPRSKVHYQLSPSIQAIVCVSKTLYCSTNQITVTNENYGGAEEVLHYSGDRRQCLHASQEELLCLPFVGIDCCN